MPMKQKNANPTPGARLHSVRCWCDEWSCADELLTRDEAWVLYYRYRQDMPSLGGHAATHVAIEDGLNQVVELWSTT